MKRILHGLCIFLAGGSLCRAEVDWPQLQYSLLASNLASPVHIAHAGDGSGQLFIVEQQGTVRIFDGTNLQSTPFLDIRTNVLISGAERGLLSIAFPPNYETSRHFYVYYTRKPNGALTLSRFSLLPGQETVNTNSEQVLITELHPNNNHNGGQMTFGPDGFLYLAMGDGAYGGNVATNPAQRLNLLLGKILRIDSENGNPYAIPPTNPFVTNAAARPEIWAYGLRNPWRFSFDRQTGDLYIADVGQIEREEINFQPAGSAGGQNYGWPIYEGNRLNSTNFPAVPTNSLTYPVAEYSNPFMSSVIGGYVYRQTNYARFAGIYFCGDFMQQRIYGMKFDEGEWKKAMLGIHPRMSAFGEDEEGNLYLLDYYGGKLNLVQDSGMAAPPRFDPASGNVANNVITVNSATPNSTIRYTLNSANPTELDAALNPGDSIIVTNSTTLRAQTFRPDLLPSLVSTSTFTPTVSFPFFEPAFGPLTNGTKITISSATSNAVFHYTIDNSAPTTNSPLYTDGVTFSGGFFLRAKGFRAGFSESAVRTVSYSWIQVATPAFTPGNGPITNGTLISISCATPGADIFYTTNETIPTTNSILYLAPFAIAGNTTVKAIAFKPNYVPSGVRNVLFSLPTVAIPVFDPAGGPVTDGTTIVITTATPGASIYYTLDGTTPTTNSALYTAPVALSANNTLSAKGVKQDYNDSAVQSTFYSWSILEKTVVRTVAGSGDPGFKDDNGILAQFNYPQGVCIGPDQSILVADSHNHRIRKIGPGGQVSTLAGSGVAGTNDAANLDAQFYVPVSVAADDLGIYVSDSIFNRIRKINSLGVVSTPGIVCSPGFCGPKVWQIQTDGSGNLFFGNHNYVTMLDTNGVFSTVAGGGFAWHGLIGVASAPSGNIYASVWNRIVLIGTNGMEELFAGQPNRAEFNDGPRSSALFENPLSCALDPAGNLFVSDTTRIRKIHTNGVVSTWAGTGIAGFANGLGESSQFGYAAGICLDTNGNVYVADAANHRIRRISADVDSDGIPDFEETAGSGFDPAIDDRMVDSDGDGESNVDEYIAGTNPLSASSRFQIKGVNRADNNLNISWDAAANRFYEISLSTNLVAWNVVTNIPVGMAGDMSFVITNGVTAESQSFYRLRVSLP